MMSLSDKPEIASVSERVKPVTAGAPVIAVHVLGDTAAFVFSEENVLLVGADGAERRVALHGGGILSSASDGKRLVTGGDDGKVMLVEAAGEPTLVATDAKRRWIDNVALHADGAVAWSAGKTAFVQPPKGEVKSLDVPSTVGGLAFAPKGFRLAVAHYNGVSLWFPNMTGVPEFKEWKGSHLGVTFSPDAKFLVSTMHESALHGWRLADTKDMRMTGYPARVRSMDWSAGGKWLATSGADTAILWPFQTKDGPMGKEPKMIGRSKSLVTAVACHPKDAVVAIGYAEGTVLMLRIDDGAEIVVRRGGGEAPAIAGLAWDTRGNVLAFADEAGRAGLLTL